MHGLPTLVLLPGMDGMGEIRAPLVSALAPRLRVVALSYPQDRPLGYAELTQIVLDRLPPGRLVMLGESFGGPIAIRIANEQPEIGRAHV